MHPDVRSIMTKKVFSVSLDSTVKDIAKFLSSHKISAAPVVNKAGKVLGVVSEGDLLKPFASANRLQRDWWLGLLAEDGNLAPVFLDYVNQDHRTAADLMTQPPVTASETASIPAVALLMIQNKVKRILIMDAGKLTGIISRADIVMAISDSPELLNADT